MAATVICGVEKVGPLSSLVGKTVDEIRDEFGDILNIPESTTPLVNDVVVRESYELVDGDELVFSRPTGQKG